jgi:outer membrane protein TolC
MALLLKRLLCPPLLILGALPVSGCASLFSGATPAPTATRSGRPPNQIQQASYQEAVPKPETANISPVESQTAPLAGVAELTAEVLVEQVLARNPALPQMVAAHQAASTRYPQVTSLEDPMFMGKIGPAAIGTNEVRDHWYMVEVSQKLPWCGKLGLKGDSALAEASAAGHDVDDMRLQLVESARSAFYDYYLAERALEVNAENLDLLKKFEGSAEDRFSKTLAPQQDVFQARVEIGRERDRRLALEEARHIAVARINTLMHLPPESPLPRTPPPPPEMKFTVTLPEPAALRTAALANRPDLQALADRIRAEEARLGLVQKEYYPDFEVAAGYDAFWDVKSQRPEVNVRLNVPVYRDKRHAAVAESQARIAERQAELARQTDQVNFQVEEAYRKVIRSAQSVRLYETTILPDAKKNVEAAQSAYEATKIPFVTLVDAQRNRVMLRDRYFEAIADYFRRRAALERVIGGSMPPGTVQPGR